MPRSQAHDSAHAHQLATATQTNHPSHDAYTALHSQFRWLVPEEFNIAQACCARWAEAPETAQSTAVITHGAQSNTIHHSYTQLQDAANRLSNYLFSVGVRQGDRVAIVLPQRFETAVAYMATLQMGAIAVPLSQLFGVEALAYRLQNSDAVLAIGDESTLPNLLAVQHECPQLQRILGIGEGGSVDNAKGRTPTAQYADFATSLAQSASQYTRAKTKSEDGAILIYTSGTTGPPKGALIPHRALIGNLSGFVCSQNWFGFDGQRNLQSQAIFWSPADWAWTGGLMDALLPALYFGRPIVAYNGRFSPEAAYTIMQAQSVTHSFLFPTALKAMMKAYPTPREHFNGLQLQAIMSAGEAVGDAVFNYCQSQLGVTVNEMFGQTEINYIVGNCSQRWPAKPNSMGKAYPGHRVAVIDEDGNECPVGVPGDVALCRHDIHGQADPIFFLGYWKNESATAAKFTRSANGDLWCRTGDLATCDAEGYLWYQGRADDVFKAAGYRIGPSEIENCLVKHPAVANAAIVPKPDPDRGAVVKAYIVLAPAYASQREHLRQATSSQPQAIAQFDAELSRELQSHVKGQLAPYEYPKEIEFIDVLPMTTTGKIQRRVLRLQEEARAVGAG